MSDSDDTWVEPGAEAKTGTPARYETVGELGRGAMGVVEAVYDTRLKRVVARKSLRRPDQSAGFRREAQVAAGLEHPGIVPIYDAAEGSWYTMRRIDGRSLQDAMDAATGLDQRLRLLPSFLRLCEAMAYVHGKGVVHRDLKPPNVMLGEFGEVVVVDFGLAVEVGEPGGRIVGTPRYMSPEAALGRPPTPATDVWSLGIVLYELLSGGRAYPGHGVEALQQVRERDPAPLPDDIPAELRAIVAKACTRDVGARYPDAAALRADVEAFTSGRLVGAYAYSPGELFSRFVRQYRTVLATAAVALVLVFTTISVAWWRTGQALDRAVHAESERTYHLARALESRARAMRGDPAAVPVARQALAIDPSLPWARGVLAQHASMLSFTMDLELPIGPCTWGQEVAGRLLVQCGRDLVLLHPETGAELDRVEWGRRAEYSGVGWIASNIRDGTTGVVRVVGDRLEARTVGAAAPEALAAATVISDLPDGRLVFGYDQGDEFVIEAERDGRFAPFRREPGRPAQRAIRSPDGTRVLLFSHHSVRVCDGWLSDCREIALPGVNQYGVWSADSRSVALFTTTGAIFRYALDTGELVLLGRERAGGVQGVVGSLDQLLVLEVTGRVQALDPSGSLVGEIDVGPSRARSIASHPRGFWLIGAEGVQRWRLDRPAHVSSVRLPNGVGAMLFDAEGALVTHDSQVVHLRGDGIEPAFSAPTFVKGLVRHRSRLLACTTASGIVGAEPGDGVELTSIGVRRCASTGGRLVFIENTTTLRVDDEARGRSRGDLDARGGRVIHEADGSVVEVREVDTWDVVFSHPAGQEVWGVALSEDGRTAAFALEDRRVRLVDLDTGTLAVLPGEHLAAVAMLRFSPSGHRLASASWDGTSFVWEDGVLAAALEGHGGRVTTLAFASDDVLYTGSWDQTVRRWDLAAWER
ncbi:MAG: protein kinase [Alphaproteobacteria bacterium]|nr:protein kinase [Alphaproteobacteria bacterium]